MDLFKILYPFEWAVSWIMYLIHKGLTFIGFSDGAGPAWVISIIGLVIVIRIVLIPLFFRQIKASRGMQLLQPELQAIQKKYKGKTDPASREAMTRETMALYKKHGTNPFSSCLPILAQSPIFFALYRVLRALQPIANGTQSPIGPLSKSVASDVERSTVFGAKLSDIFVTVNSTQSKIVIVGLILLMCVTMFVTQRQLTMKNMPPSALEGPMASTQKMLMYGYPVIFAISGINFPVGVLVYWSTTNLWSMGQQFYTIRRMPAPGSEAERHMKERQARKAAAHGGTSSAATSVIEEAKGGQRVQPKRQSRSARKTGALPAALPATSSGETTRDEPEVRSTSRAPIRDAATDDEPSVLESARSKSRRGARSSAKAAPKSDATTDDSGTSVADAAGSAAADSNEAGRQASTSRQNDAAEQPAPGGADKPAASGAKPSAGRSTSSPRQGAGSAIKKGGARKGSGGGRPQSAKKSKK